MLTTSSSLSKEVLLNDINEPKYSSIYNHKSDQSLVDLDLFTQGHPFGLYKELREKAPIYKHPSISLFDPEPDFWVLTKYRDIMEVSMNPKIFSSQYGTGTMITLGSVERRHPKLFRTAIDHMLNLDGDLHLNLRKQHMPFFKPGYVEELQKKVASKVTGLLDDIAPLGECNLVEHVSQKLPIFTLSEILGIPEDDRDKIITWMHFLEIAQYMQVEQLKKDLNQSTDESPNQEMIDLFNQMVDEMFDYGKFILNKKRNDPKDDLLSAIANAEVYGEKLSQEFLDGSWLLIILAGNDTTRNTISGGIKLLSENPEQRKILLNNFDLLPNFVNETIRCISPVIHMRRTSTEETQIGDQKIGQGEKIVMWYGAANRDPDIFSNPDNFDIQRENSAKHLAFGMGRHMCLGKPIALMQLHELYKQLLNRFPNMEVSGNWKVAPNNFVLAIQEMPVKFS